MVFSLNQHCLITLELILQLDELKNHFRATHFIFSQASFWYNEIVKIILTMAISANGIIASKTGSEDFLSHTNWLQFVKLAKRVGCFMWGRKTYEAVIKWEGDYLKDLESVKKIIISGSNIDLNEGFELAHSPEEAIGLLENEGFTEAIITGGATINSEF